MSAVKVLCIDDDVTVAQMIADIVAYCRQELVVLSDSFDVVNHLTDPNMKVVLTDYMMPKLDGLEVLTLVQERRPDVRRVLITAAPHEALVREAFKTQLAQLVIAKPPTIADIKLAVAWL